MSLRVGVLGAAGAMGRHVTDALGPDDRLQAAVVRGGAALEGAPVPGHDVRYQGLEVGVFGSCDVVIDFSLPEGLAQALPLLGTVPLVTGTTGLTAAHQALLQAHAQRAPVLQAANFSVGITLLVDLVRRAAAAMADADVEIVELHHRRKRDAPSGTALALAEAVSAVRPTNHTIHGRDGAVGPREPSEVGVHAVRGGDVVGDHTVWLLADGERVALQHIASGRQTFALGALRAARWLVDQGPGSYTMHEVVGLGDTA